jgi:hypothetical protein
MNEPDLLTRCDNAMINWLTPEEFEQFAEVDRIEKESEATIAALFEKVKGRDVTSWQDKESAEELAVLEKLTPKEREFYRLAYAEELKQFIQASRAMGEALISKSNFYRIAGERMF